MLLQCRTCVNICLPKLPKNMLRMRIIIFINAFKNIAFLSLMATATM
jgi:hypothetical protein